MRREVFLQDLGSLVIDKGTSLSSLDLDLRRRKAAVRRLTAPFNSASLRLIFDRGTVANRLIPV